MKPMIFYNHYVIIDQDGDVMFHTITDEKAIAVYQHLADAHPSSVTSIAIEKGFKLIKCDIVLTNIRNEDHRI